MGEYNHKKIEEDARKKWEKDSKLYVADEKSEAEKTYILDMFPYPSSEGLHTGHVESYTATDIISRYLRMKGKNVLHPQGWDAFGLPAENFAIKTKTHPATTTKEAIANYKKQMDMLGFSYDWSREINSSDPDYYKWTQWFFLLLYKNGLAYRAEASVNWCESCQTVLANEQVENGVCERCKNEVKQKKMKQWFFKITDFIEPSFAPQSGASEGQKQGRTSGLLDGLDKVDWPESTKAAQKNWIGKSEGAIVKFAIKSTDLFLDVFTTRLDTIFGCTYCVLAPEHPLIENLESKIDNYEEVKKYIEEAKKKSELQRMAEQKEKTGRELKGIKAINPFNNEEIPIFVADYVLMNYGTGAVMAVPAHDHRDFEFAKKLKLPIKAVIMPVDQKIFLAKSGVDIQEKEFPSKEDPKYKFVVKTISESLVEWPTENDGVLINSDQYDELTSQNAREEMVKWLEKNKLGVRKINYKLRDWLISRQRYWGAPIPIVYCEKCARLRQGYGGQGEFPVPEKDLPVELPNDVDFIPTGESPLARSKKFHNVKCPKCGAKARRESDTMDTFVCSSWYYFRYADPKNKKEFASKKAIKKWLPVDLYVGGAEHTVLHLLYSRFFTKALHNLGYIDFDEPFLKLRHQGMILAEDGRKMSKSLGNVINPDEIVERFGTDALRMYEMFMGPLEDTKPWNTNGIIGICRFLERIWKVVNIFNENKRSGKIKSGKSKLIHKTIKKVSEDIECLKFNTAISSMMEFFNKRDFGAKVDAHGNIESGEWDEEAIENFLIILSPFAPHLAEELWEKLGSSYAKASKDKHKKSIFYEKWPEYDAGLIKEETFELVVQINGKVRDKISAAIDVSENEAKEMAMKSEKIQKWVEGKEIKKVIFVKNRLINFII